MAVYAAIKLPLVLALTAALAAPSFALLARVLGIPSGSSPLGVAFASLAGASRLLLALTPVVLLFSLSAPRPDPSATTTHNLLYLLHVALVGASGLVGLGRMREELSRSAASARTARRVVVLWTLLFGFVGGEVAWALRPFVGSVHEPVRFLRENALDGNVYEFVLTDVAPHLLRTARKEILE